MRSAMATLAILVAVTGACRHASHGSPSAPGEREYFPPPDDQGGWRTPASAEEALRVAGMDVAALKEPFDYIQKTTKNGGLVVVRNGWLVFERYFGLGHREATPNLASCGKSFTSIAMGILLEQRRDLFPAGLDTKVFDPKYLPAFAFPLTDPGKAEIKLGQLLSMSGGIRGNNPVRVDGKPSTIEPAGPDGWQGMVDEIALGKEDGIDKGSRVSATTLWCAPGGGYSYATASIHIVSLVVRHVAGMELDAFLAEQVAKPLGWSRWGFGYKSTRAGARMSGGGGITLRATDMARFGYLLLHEGRWVGHQVVPAEYVRQCGRQSPYNPHYAYSLQFTVNTNGQIPTLPRDAFWKSGSGGHVIFVVPSLNLVVFKMGGRDEQYAQANTGMAPPIPVETQAGREWKPSVATDGAETRTTLEMVIAAIRN